MKFCTEIQVLPPSKLLQHSDGLAFVGSCFADNIGRRLARAVPHCMVNPYGAMFNPISVLSCLKNIATAPADWLLRESDGLRVSLLTSNTFAANTEEELLASLTETQRSAQKTFSNTNTLVITFGTAYAYREKRSGEIAANCHRLPSADFECRLLSVDEIVSAYTPFLSQWLDNENRQIVFTVSPVRHLRDGLHNNNVSKSILLIAINELLQIFPSHSSYFPAYEILLDELRDYRFYADDMLHPSEQAVEHIYSKFIDNYFTTAAKASIAELTAFHAMQQHRLMHPQSKSGLTFAGKLAQENQRLLTKYPFLHDLHQS